MTNIEQWPIPDDLRRDAEDNYRTRYALALASRSPMDIIRDLTFDAEVPQITVEGIEDLFSFIERSFLRRSFHGVGLEVGAGPVVFGSILARRPAITRVYGIEICRPIVEQLFPKVSSFLLGDRVGKVTGVVGSFDDMQLPDASVDFILDFFSLHHSLDLTTTLKECARVLKPGGFILCLDKARPDSYSSEQLDQLMDTEYKDDYKKLFGIPLEQRLTRRMNGEREYRLKDWRAAFADAGFGRVDHFNLQQTIGSFPLRQIKTVLSYLPAKLQTLVTRFLPSPRFGHAFIHEGRDRVFCRQLNLFRKEMSVLIAYR